MNKTLEERLEDAYAQLSRLESAYEKAIAAYSWTTRDGDSTREVVNQNLSVLSTEIARKKAEISALESQIANGGRSGKAFRIGQIF